MDLSVNAIALLLGKHVLLDVKLKVGTTKSISGTEEGTNTR
jgi:hypothetical protein